MNGVVPSSPPQPPYPPPPPQRKRESMGLLKTLPQRGIIPARERVLISHNATVMAQELGGAVPSCAGEGVHLSCVMGFCLSYTQACNGLVL